ncbi:Serine/Threonine-Protein Kinase Ulk1 [Manis pentadactyla]|nr:Serine/Threonine-Protein Kinase Ulk1 [Manis pentadactyla]
MTDLVDSEMREDQHWVVVLINWKSANILWEEDEDINASMQSSPCLDLRRNLIFLPSFPFPPLPPFQSFLALIHSLFSWS